jgi:hypothetical protein
LNADYGYGSLSHTGRDHQAERSSAYHSSNALSDDASTKNSETTHAIEPQHAPGHYQHGEQEASLFSQVANHILGSWDTTMVSTNSSADEAMPMAPEDVRPAAPFSHSQIPPPFSLDKLWKMKRARKLALIAII